MASEYTIDAYKSKSNFLGLFYLLFSLVGYAGVDNTVAYLREDEIKQIQDLIFVQQEPLFVSTYGDLIEDADSYLRSANPSVVTNGGANDPHQYYSERPYCGWFSFFGLLGNGCKDGQYNPDADRYDYNAAVRMAKEGATLALAYRLSGEKAYAEKILDMIDVWVVDKKTYLAPHFTNGQSRIELSITHLGLFYATNLVWDYEGWDAKKKLSVTKWIAAWGKSVESWQGTNNFEDWRIAFRLSIYSMIKDDEELAKAIDDFKKRIPDTISVKGEMVAELERKNSLTYSLYAINAMVQSAEIAYMNGVDLYRYRDSRGVGLEVALDYHVPFALSSAVEKWPHQQIAKLIDRDVAIYELAYKRYGKKSYAGLLKSWGRPLTEARVIQWISLSHGVILKD